jgi:TRL (tRNA-associated locus)-like protein
MGPVVKSGIIAILVAALLLTGCVYGNIQRPLGTEFDKTELGTKKGEASNYSVLWLVAWGDGGTKAAAENGHIAVIRHADARFFFLLFGLYTKVTTVVYGD